MNGNVCTRNNVRDTYMLTVKLRRKRNDHGTKRSTD